MAVLLANFVLEAGAGAGMLVYPTLLFGVDGLHGGGRIASAFFGVCAVAQGLACLFAFRGTALILRFSSAATQRTVAFSSFVYHVSLCALWFVFPEFNQIGANAAASLSKSIPATGPLFASLSNSTRDKLAMACLLGIHGLMAIGLLLTGLYAKDKVDTSKAVTKKV